MNKSLQYFENPNINHIRKATNYLECQWSFEYLDVNEIRLEKNTICDCIPEKIITFDNGSKKQLQNYKKLKTEHIKTIKVITQLKIPLKISNLYSIS